MCDHPDLSLQPPEAAASEDIKNTAIPAAGYVYQPARAYASCATGSTRQPGTPASSATTRSRHPQPDDIVVERSDDLRTSSR
jgi:hypothetical protein